MGQILKTHAFKRLSIANPKLAPYGLAAIETLKKLELLTDLQSKMIYADSIAQAYQWVASENAELGFVARSQVFQDGKISKGSAWIVPSELHTPIQQDAVLLKSAKDQEVAIALMNYLKGDKIKALIRSFGYDI